MTGLAAALGACGPLAINPPLGVLDQRPPAREADGTRWCRFDELADPTVVGPLIEQFRAATGITHRAAGGIRFLKELIRDPLYIAVATTFLVDDAPDIGPDNLWLRWTAGRAGGSALARPTTARDEPAVDLDRWLAERLVASFGPLIDAIRARTRAGTRLLWGYVSDMTHFRTLQAARETGGDAQAAWRRADRLCAAYVAAGAPIKSAPRPFEMVAGEPPVLWAVRGVCCLDYRADPAHGYCATCPLEHDDVRRGKLSWLVRR